MKNRPFNKDIIDAIKQFNFNKIQTYDLVLRIFCEKYGPRDVEKTGLVLFELCDGDPLQTKFTGLLTNNLDKSRNFLLPLLIELYVEQLLELAETETTVTA